MAKKALIVGVSNYAPIAPNIESSAFETRCWRDLLIEKYNFAKSNIRLLENRRATKLIILDHLTWLLGNAKPGDQLVYVFSGHGARGHRTDARGRVREREDEALVPFPTGATTLIENAIFDDELRTLYDRMAVPAGALPTFVLNSCHSAGIDFAVWAGQRASVAPPPASGFAQHAAPAVAGFYLQPAEGPRAEPVVIAAAKARSVAVEVERENRTRSLFSMLALDALALNPGLTYTQLLDVISPQMRYASQEPRLCGDAERMKKQFFH